MREFNVKSYLQKFVYYHLRIKKRSLNLKTRKNLKDLKIEKNENLKNVNL